jgi:hypothetical protein
VNFEKDFPHDNICYDCAIAKGGVMPALSQNTVWEGKCKYCKKKKGLLSLRDFNWPKYRRGYIWD